MVVWYVRNLRLAGVTSDMHLLAHGQHGLAFADGYRMILDWFLPGLVVQRVTAIPLLAPLLVVGLALTAFIYGVGTLRRRWAWRPANAGGGELLGLHAIHFGPYAVFLYATAALLLPPATISERTLAPAFLSALILLVGGLAWVTRERPWIVRVFIGLLLAGMIYNKSIWTLGLADRLRQQGQGYTSAAWLASETLAAVDELNPTLIYSNEIPAIYLRLDRYANDLPEEVEAPRAEIHPNHETIDEYRRRLRQTPGAVLVLFVREGIVPSDAAFEPFTRRLTLVGTYSDGAIYRAPSE